MKTTKSVMQGRQNLRRKSVHVEQGPRWVQIVALVQQAFSKVDFDGSGLVSEEEIAAAYNPSQHPDVLAGKRSKQEIMNEFMATFVIIFHRLRC